MRCIDLETWPRREQYHFINTFDYPHFSLCANVDITAFKTAVKQRGVSFTVAAVYVLVRAANEIPEFRCRIHGDDVVEFEVVHPRTTYLTEGDLFSFCQMPYSQDFSLFAQRAAEQIALIQDHPAVENEPQDNVLFMTSIPWVSFTGFMHPILRLSPSDSIPRFAWGKFFQEGECLKMPLSVQAHHALVDGVHAGRYYEIVQGYLDQPESFL